MKKDYTIIKCDYVKGCRWLVLKRINKMVQVHVFGALTKKECQEWIDKNVKHRKTNKRTIIKARGRKEEDES